MLCQRCTADKVLTISARAKDMHVYDMPDGTQREGYASWFSLDGDTTQIPVCMNCGQVQGNFPMSLEVADEEG